MGKQEKNRQCKKSRSNLFTVDNRKWRTFHFKDDNGKLWVEVFIVTQQEKWNFAPQKTRGSNRRLTTNNNDVNLVKTPTEHFAWLFRFDRIYKLDGD